MWLYLVIMCAVNEIAIIYFLHRKQIKGIVNRFSLWYICFNRGGFIASVCYKTSHLESLILIGFRLFPRREDKAFIDCVLSEPEESNRKEGTSMKRNRDQEFLNVSGQVPYRMINDYLFRAVLQSNNKALRGLICALLHLTEEEVFSVEITNPVILGETVTNKEFRLDINVVLNNHTLINLEMQIANRLNWRERSVMYLCRSFDQLNHGQDYVEAKPVIHIGFLDYSLTKECPEFCASYKFINTKSFQKYSDSLTLYVIDLSHIELATEEDKRYHIHEWAMLFKAATWEEVRMIASKDEYLNEAAQTMFRMSADDLIRKRCRDREEYYQDLRNYERVIEENERKREQDRLEHEQDLRNYERVIAEKEQEYDKVIAENERLRAELARLKKS